MKELWGKWFEALSRDREEVPERWQTLDGGFQQRSSINTQIRLIYLRTAAEC